MRNSTFRKNGQVFGFVLQPLLTVGTAAMWEKEQLRSAEVQSRSLWFLYKELMFSSHFLLFHHISRYCFFVKSGKFLNCNSIQIYFRGEKYNNASADLHYLKTDLFLWVLQFMSGCKSCGNWETAVKINKWDTHAFNLFLHTFKTQMEGTSTCDSGRSSRFFFFLTQ